MARPTKKRRIDQPVGTRNAGENAQKIGSARELQDLMSDYSGAGLPQFKEFLQRCGPEVGGEDESKRNLGFLKVYLEAQCKQARKDRSNHEEGAAAFPDIAQIWSYAFQNNAGQPLTYLPAALASLVRICSYHEDLRTFGKTLIASLLQQANIKIIYRCIGGKRDNHISPCLRLLTEMNRFNFGSMCGQVHSTFDFTVKDFVKIFEIRKSAKNEPEDLTKPSVRTHAVRFFLSFLQNGEPTTRNDMVGVRTWVSAIFKNIKSDIGAVISEVLETLASKVINERDIPRATKTIVFNEWVLGHILSLSSRNDTVKISRAGKEEEKTVSELSQEFLLKVCTTTGNGICFADQGWFPPGATGNDEKKPNAPKVYNRALSSFANNVRPYADTLQLGLLLAIFKACPEIVANYFLSNTPFNFEPKLTSTWIGYCTFLSSVIALPVPTNFGSSKDLLIPPSASVVIENILPKPLAKTVLGKCLSHSNKLIKFLSTRLLITCFQKLKTVLGVMDAVVEGIDDPTGLWLKCRMNVMEEFCKRVPETSRFIGRKLESNGILQSEAHTRLLSEYYTQIPGIALAGKFDINLALSNLLNNELNDDKNGIRLLQIGHLLKIANQIPDAKWWNKTPGMSHSPFVSILKHSASSPSRESLRDVYALLQSFALSSYLFQTETPIFPLEALLDSLAIVTGHKVFEPILVLLDEVVARCIRTPFKYLDDFTELAIELWRPITKETVYVQPVSPFIMALSEQWKFFGKDIPIDQKLVGANWLVRCFDSFELLGENRRVLAVLCERMINDTEEEQLKQVFLQAKKIFEVNEPVQLVVEGKSTTATNLAVGRAFIESGEILDTTALDSLKESQDEGVGSSSLFRLACYYRVSLSIARGCQELKKPSLDAIVLLQSMMKRDAQALAQQGWGDSTKIIKTFLANEVVALNKNILDFSINTTTLFEFFHGFVTLLSIAFDENDISEFEEARKALPNAVAVILSQTERSIRTQTIEKNNIQRLQSDIRTLFQINLDSVDLNGLLKSLCCQEEFLAVNSSPTLSTLLNIFVEKDKKIDVEAINSIIASDSIPDRVSEALVRYISNVDKNDLEGLDWSHVEEKGWTDIECALIKKLDTIRQIVLKTLKNSVGTTEDKAARLTALLEGYSVHEAKTNKFLWNSSAGESIRKKLQKNFIAIQKTLLLEEGGLSQAKLNLFLRTSFLFPEIDDGAGSKVLGVVIRDTKKENLTDLGILLIDRLVKDDKVLLSTEMQAWLLTAFNHLTRRFAEDDVVSETVRGFAKALASFLERRKLPIENILPRAALNAVIEAAIGKHIGITEAIYFAVTIVNLTGPKVLELSKFLQVILGHPGNPLSKRGISTYDSDEEEIHGYVLYLTCKMFWATKHTASNLATLDAALELYRGTDSPIDRSILEIIAHIEGHLARSCASRITTWIVAEHAGRQPLISRTKGRLNVVIDSKKLQKGVYQFSPTVQGETAKESTSAQQFLKSWNQYRSSSGGKKCYDPKFLLPCLTYCLISDDIELDFQSAVEKHCVGFALVGLCSTDRAVHTMSIGHIGAFLSQLETSPSRNKTQITHLLCMLLATLESEPTSTLPLPAALGIFFASALQVLSNPAHFLYEKVMELLLHAPLLNLHDIPYMLAFAQVRNDPHRETIWILTILTTGLKTPADLALYRKRNVFGTVMNLYLSPNSTERAKEKILELLWNAADVEGGSTTLITRNGVVSWIEMMLSDAKISDEGKLKLRRLAARLWESSAKMHVEEWSKGGVKMHFLEKGGMLAPPSTTL